MMKKILTILVLSLAMFAISCSDNEQESSFAVTPGIDYSDKNNYDAILSSFEEDYSLSDYTLYASTITIKYDGSTYVTGYYIKGTIGEFKKYGTYQCKLWRSHPVGTSNLRKLFIVTHAVKPILKALAITLGIL